MFIVWHFVAAGFISSIVVSLVQHGLALPLAPEPAEGSKPRSQVDVVGAAVAAFLILLMTTTGVLSVLRECNSYHVLYGKDDVAVRAVVGFFRIGVTF